jgi:hypothetical protein
VKVASRTHAGFAEQNLLMIVSEITSIDQRRILHESYNDLVGS